VHYPAPQDFARRILLAVSGNSPQILTETLYALGQQRGEPFVPTEVRLITTSSGAYNARYYLLNPGEGHFLAYCREYGLDPGVFDSSAIHVIADSSGRQLDDIRTLQENEAAADYITDTIRGLTEDPGAALHVSMAGGRKTMGYYAGYALSLFGRAQDRLSHVLVSEPYEGLRTFYFPTRESCLIETREQRVLDARDAVVTLAEIPFVRLREEIPEQLLAGKAGFNETIQFAQAASNAEHLTIDLPRKRLLAGGREVALPASQFAFYAWLIRRQLDGLSEPGVRDMAEPNSEFAREFLTLYAAIEGEMGKDIEPTRKALRQGMDREWFYDKRTRINKALKTQLGRALGERHAIASFGKYGNTRYGVMLDAEQIDWID